MNNSVNVQSPNFGMAYKVSEMKNLTRYLNNQEPKAISELSTKMLEAAEKLKDTKYTNVFLTADDKGENLYHIFRYYEPKFNEKGVVENYLWTTTLGSDIDNAVAEALEKEKAMTAAFEYAKKQEQVLKDLCK